MIWRMLYFSDLQQLSVHEQMLVFAGAYLDSAEVLCNNLYSDKERANYAHGAVVMSLAFHSLELFFKGCILRSFPAEQFNGKAGHDLDALSKRFFRLYPKKEFQFEVPFRYETSGIIEKMAPNELAELLAYIEEHRRKAPEDQRHRYPISGNGKTWEGAFGFEPNSFLVTLRELQQVYARIRSLLYEG
ncbi:hypothetical protein [Nitrosomonas ureae]|uniref:HEPN domain-containing protein n=2 Tax=Nitrosomonas ureae TaxID=44577 RepID=A0A1H2EZG7_9PROT|nr:hypothetical protein [Nitrosomonas ureae]SDU00504.1 hypothetical protein SAMN05216406_11661 [Nitrosomonas ureae]